MNTIKITTTQNIELEYDLASLGERIVGYLIDSLVMIAYLVVLVFISLSLVSNRFIYHYTWVPFIFYIPIYFYTLAFEVFMNGQTIGKRVMKIKVISIDGAKPTLGQYLIRWIFRLVDISLSFFLCGIICIAVSERKQRVGDMVAGTAVIKTEPRTTFQQTLYIPTQPVDYVVTYPQITTLGDQDIQLIKEVIIISRNSGNHSIAEKAAEKISETLKITNNMESIAFLNVLLSDYNYLTSKGEA
jgi:uncharacterized RDD family membrane protein YckC